jgi:hypothetical protein
VARVYSDADLGDNDNVRAFGSRPSARGYTSTWSGIKPIYNKGIAAICC